MLLVLANRRGHVPTLTAVAAILILLSACRSRIGVVGPEVVSPATDSRPAASWGQPAPTAMPAETVSAPPSPTSIQTSTPNAPAVTPVSSLETEPAPTDTRPPPTFTPPPPPPLVAGEHFWLSRPVPASESQWTDKAYPYGSTRGGLLRPHHGVEFNVPPGTPVSAVAGGTVLFAGDDSQTSVGPQPGFYGEVVVIELFERAAGPVYTVYGHMSEILVQVGQVVDQGEVIGLSGATGVADGPHLHLEVRAGSNSYSSTRNPLLWLNPLPQTGIVAGRIIGPTGDLLDEAPVTLVRVDGPAPYTATTSYAANGPNRDDMMAENFVLDDVLPGYYEVVAGTGNQRATGNVWVFPGRTNWVEIVVDGR